MNWRAVIAESTSLLQNRTKNLRLAVWLAETLSKECDFAGLREDYELIAGLCEQFQEHLYPLPEIDDPEARTGSMAWLATRSSQLIRGVPPVEAGKGGYSLVDQEVATSLVEVIRRDPEQAGKLSRGKITLEQFESARHVAPPIFYKTLHDDMVGYGAALLRLESILNTRTRDHTPNFHPAREASQAVYALVERFSGRPEPKPTTMEAEGIPQQTAQSTSGTVTETVVSDPIRTRAQALNQLRDVAEFFRQTEPHSPIAYLTARAAKRGDMPLRAWLRAVVKDDATLSRIEELLGLGDPSSEGAS